MSESESAEWLCRLGEACLVSSSYRHTDRVLVTRRKGGMQEQEWELI